MVNERIEKLKAILREELPDHKLLFESHKNKEIIGTFNQQTKEIKINPAFAEDEKVIAHEIAHAIEFKRYGQTSHRNRLFWMTMEHHLGVPLITYSPSGRSTLRAIEFREKESPIKPNFSDQIEKTINKMEKRW